MSFSPPVACATDRSKAVFDCGSYSIRMLELKLVQPASAVIPLVYFTVLKFIGEGL